MKKTTKASKRRTAGRRNDQVTEVFNWISVGTTVVSGTAQLLFGIVSGVGATGAVDCDRLLDILDIFSMYRVNFLEIEFLNSAAGAAEVGYAAATSGSGGDISITTPPATLTQAAELQHFAMVLPGQITPVKFRVSGLLARGAKDWYDTTSEQPFALYVGTYATATGNATADSLMMKCRLSITLSGAADPSMLAKRVRESRRPQTPVSRSGYIEVPRLVTEEELSARGERLVSETTRFRRG